MNSLQVCLGTCLIVLLGFELGCVTTPESKPGEKQETTYGTSSGTFRGRWWNYYERGVSLADEHLWNDAETDLREALRQRGEDQRRARTYGMHFSDYFPHRELGVVLFHQKRYEDALRELENSLRNEKSAKAEFYLDLTRKTLIQERKRDVRAPEVIINSPEQGALSNGFTVVVSGVVRDEAYVKHLAVNGLSVRIDLAAAEVPFRVELPTTAGVNVIRIVAANLIGKTTTLERQVRVDRQGPILSIDEPVEGAPRPGQPLRLQGYAYDDSGVQEIIVNGRQIPISPSPEIRLDYPIPATPNLRSVVVEARDRIGNLTRAEVNLSDQATGPRRVHLASLDIPNLAFLGKIAAHGDSRPPSIELRNWTDQQTVFLDQIYLEGSVRGDAGVTHLAINGQSILKKPGKNVYFGYLARLNQGDNPFGIEAQDGVGNRIEKQIHVHRKLQKIRQIGSRLTVALLPFERLAGPGLGSETIEEILLSGLVERGRFEMLERRRLEEILREQKLSRTQLADPDTAIRVGKIMAANAVLIGSVLEREGSLEIYARLVDTETSLVIAAIDVYGEEVDPMSLKQLCQGLILKLCDEIPLIEGMVVQVKSSHALVDLGVESRIKKGMRLIIFEEGEPVRHPVTGAMLGADTEVLSRGLVQAVHEQMSEVEILTKGVQERIKPKHKAITQ